MIAKTEQKHIRISPKKFRLVIDMIRGKSVMEAEAVLLNSNKRPREVLLKLLHSAMATAKVKGFGPDQLYISTAICNIGPVWKRYKAAAFGRAAPIKRRTCHVKLELDSAAK